MPMSRPAMQNIITTGQLLNAMLLFVGLIIGGCWWVFGKDRADVDLGGKLDGVSAQVARMDGKLEAYGAAQNALGSRVDLLDQRQQASDETAKEGRVERQGFQRETESRLGQLEQRVGVVEALRSARP